MQGLQRPVAVPEARSQRHPAEARAQAKREIQHDNVEVKRTAEKEATLKNVDLVHCFTHFRTSSAANRGGNVVGAVDGAC